MSSKSSRGSGNRQGPGQQGSGWNSGGRRNSGFKGVHRVSGGGGERKSVVLVNQRLEVVSDVKNKTVSIS